MTRAHLDLIIYIQENYNSANTGDITPDDFVISEEYDFADPQRERIVGMNRGGMKQRKKDLTYSTAIQEFPIALELYTIVSQEHADQMEAEITRIWRSIKRGFTVGSNNYSQIDLEQSIPVSIPRAGRYIYVMEFLVHIFMKDI